MDEPESLPTTDAAAVAVVAAIRSGDDEFLSQLLIERAGLATARLVYQCGVARTLLHVVTDWPGYFPNGPRTVERLLAAGADPDAATIGGSQPETPLHWAASSDDLEVAEALIAGGAAIDVPGGSIGTPVENAVGYGCCEYLQHYNAHRPHRSLDQRPPAGGTPTRPGASLRPLRRDRLSGLIHEYVQVA